MLQNSLYYGYERRTTPESKRKTPDSHRASFLPISYDIGNNLLYLEIYSFWLRIVGIVTIVYVGECFFHTLGDFFFRRLFPALVAGDRSGDCCEVLAYAVNGSERRHCFHIVHTQFLGGVEYGIKQAVEGAPVVVVCSGGVLKSVYRGESCVAYLYGIVQ